MTPNQLTTICGIPEKMAEHWAPYLNAAADKAQINTNMRWAAFLAQVMVESSALTTIAENLNYSAKGLLTTFPGRYDKKSKTRIPVFTSDEAEHYARHPEMIANRVYANRMGNGDEASGDGWKHRGAGLIQVTGHDNQTAFGKWANLPDLCEAATIIQSSELCALSAGWFWYAQGLNLLADTDDCTAVTRAVNGGSNGLPERQAYYTKFLTALEA